MMFRKISNSIALQFTGFIFALFLLNGFIFLAADYSNARRESYVRLDRTARFITSRPYEQITDIPIALAPPARDRVRITDAEGNVLYSGSFFSDIPFSSDEGYSEIVMQSDEYTILTMRIKSDDTLTGYVQVADVERLQHGDLPLRALLYLLVSLGISGLTFLVALFFTRRSLKPAEEMVVRLEQFTQDASHELKTPLAALSSSLDLSLKTEKYREGILSAKDDLKQVVNLVERLLELARLDKLVIEHAPVDLSSLVTETVEKHRILANQKSIEVVCTVDAKVKHAGDAPLLRQILSNLLANAIKFTAAGGRITVKLTNRALSVTDTGIGIEEKDIAHIFDRFYQVDNSRSSGGTGLGLALVKRIVDLHGWSIGVQSVKGKGSTFTVYFSASRNKKQP